MLGLLICIPIVIILIVIAFITSNQEKIKQNYFDKHKQEWDNLLKEKELEYEEKQKQIQNKFNEEMNEKQMQLRQFNEIVNEEISESQKKIDFAVNTYKSSSMDKAKLEIEQQYSALKDKADNEFKTFLTQIAEQKEITQNESNLLIAQLEDYKQKINVINENIMRDKEKEEKENFFRVCLNQNQIEDIEMIMSIREKLHQTNNLNKLLYDVYVSKEVNEMIKRVLKGDAPSGIYKITRLKTKEIYIGKSTDVKARWQQHCKTVFGVGTIAHSILHTTMEKDGIENFTFELIEEVPKDKLGEREKFWIDFYDSKKYGLNERAGG